MVGPVPLQSTGVFQTWSPAQRHTSTLLVESPAGVKRKRNILKHMLIDIHENEKKSRENVRYYFAKQTLPTSPSEIAATGDAEAVTVR